RDGQNDRTRSGRRAGRNLRVVAGGDAAIYRAEDFPGGSQRLQIATIPVGRNEAEAVPPNDPGHFTLGVGRTREEPDQIALSERSVSLLRRNRGRGGDNQYEQEGAGHHAQSGPRRSGSDESCVVAGGMCKSGRGRRLHSRIPMEIVMRYLLSLLLWPVALTAQGWIIPRPCETCIPRCRPDVACVPITPAITRASSAVHVSLAGNVLQYDVDETYVNGGAGLGEADYYFPLPRGAAFQDLKLSIDGKLVAGEVMDAAEARRVYENIVRVRRDPALVEWMGYGMLHARIFPIAPGERKRVEVRFQMVAEREGDALRVDYRGASQPGGNVRNDHEGEWSFTLTYPRTAAYGNPYSPTSALDVHDSQGERTVDVREAGRDVTVLLPVHERRAAAITVLPYAAGGGDDFALITISPPDTRQHSMPRDVTFVVDVSGSMSGGKLDQARAAGKRLLETLGADDRFRIIDF